MWHVIRLDKDWNEEVLRTFFECAQCYERGAGPHYVGGAALFFPPSSLRTRASFEMGAVRMGIHPLVFPPESLDKPEALEDVAGYLSQWVDLLVVRHPRIEVMESLAAFDVVPVINAMTSENHPCEVLSDLYALSRTRDPLSLRYVFVGARGNIACAWIEAAHAFGLDLIQCCPQGLATPGAPSTEDLIKAMDGADVVITDGPGPYVEELRPYQVTAAVLAHAPQHVQLVPCPPFIRGREVSSDAIASAAFSGYDFKRPLIFAQQAIMAMALGFG